MKILLRPLAWTAKVVAAALVVAAIFQILPDKVVYRVYQETATKVLSIYGVEVTKPEQITFAVVVFASHLLTLLLGGLFALWVFLGIVSLIHQRTPSSKLKAISPDIEYVFERLDKRNADMRDVDLVELNGYIMARLEEICGIERPALKDYLKFLGLIRRAVREGDVDRVVAVKKNFDKGGN